jgi:hypothetical protein
MKTQSAATTLAMDGLGFSSWLRDPALQFCLNCRGWRNGPGENTQGALSMLLVRSALVAGAIAGMVLSGQVAAQTPAPAGQDTSAPAKEPSTAAKIQSKADDVAKWTGKEYRKAKAEWVKEKEKWAECQKQKKDQGLTGRKSWSFLATCMTSST